MFMFILQFNEVNMANMENFMRAQQNVFSMMNPFADTPLLPGVQNALVFSNIERNRIVSSAIENVDRYWSEDSHVWLMPLEVQFGRGEYAIDAGGPSKVPIVGRLAFFSQCVILFILNFKSQKTTLSKDFHKNVKRHAVILCRQNSKLEVHKS